jgi:CSLREA domain-containing protein
LKRLLLSAIAVLCLAFPASGLAATFTVNSTADGPVTGTCAAGETCTLRDALKAAEGSADAEDQVVIPAGHFTLGSGELRIVTTGSVSLAGAGARKTVIDGAGASRVLSLSAPSGSGELSATLSGLTVTGGAESGAGVTDPGDGGGILFSTGGNELILRGVAVTGNTATINGGGVAATFESAAPKTVVVEDSTIAGNKIAGGAVIGLGGGLFVTGNLKMTNSTVAGNSIENAAAMTEGGGVLAGPAMTSTEPTQTTIVNSTIAGNSVMTGTGGGFAMYNPSALAGTTSTITNTIIAGNTAMGMSANCGGAMTIASSHDLSSDLSCLFTDAASKVNTAPLLGPLANNGGETDTLALLAGSPAIDAGTSAGCPATDQRGVARPLGAACDIGAYEFQPTVAPPPPPPAASADLALTIEPKPMKPKRGKKLTFLVKVRDAGPSAATGVTFRGTIPVGAKVATPKAIGRKACKTLQLKKKGKRRHQPLSVTCALGTIAAGQTVTFRVGVKTATAPNMVKVSGMVNSAVADPNPTNSKAKATAKLTG